MQRQNLLKQLKLYIFIIMINRNTIQKIENIFFPEEILCAEIV